MIPSAEFTIGKSILLKSLSQFIKITGRGPKNRATIEITIVDDFIHLVVPGIILKLPAMTKSTAKFTVRLLYFNDVVKTHRLDPLKFIIEGDMIKVDGYSFKAKTTFFETDEILRSIDLPINYQAGHLINLTQSGGFTPAEIAFNNLEQQRIQALKTLKDDINKIALIARKYGFSRKEIDAFINSKILKKDVSKG